MKKVHGGARPGAGRKAGGKNKATIAKEEAREIARALITADLQPLIAAQIENAKGLKYLVTRDKGSGKFIRVTEAMAKAGKGEEIIEVWEKDPSVQAFSDLLNRALDKPKEQQIEIKVTNEEERIARLHEGRRRAAAARKAQEK